MTTREKPRKLPAENDGDLSVSQLASIPLKRRLEILFASNIIPCRRQLAKRYELSEQLIHNVLSHRKYLLENWKYNDDAKSLLSKLELENAMAMTELLIEWKRRVQLNGLQITDEALTRKAVYLQRVLNGSSDGISDKWWDQFDINWVYKRFQDYESDSLEIQDILNDLQWMFPENTFRRLISSFRKAKNSRVLGAGGKHVDQDSKTKTEGFDDFGEDFDISAIKAEPHYYNDDDFECEDYEFVLDEEVVIDSLRKELEDSEQAKYQQYLLGGINNDCVSEEEEKVTEILVEDQDYDEKEDAVDEVETENENDFVENMDSSLQQSSPTTSDVPAMNEDVPDEELHSPVPIRTATGNSVTLPTQPTRPKRKPRNMHAVLSLRKDYVRMPAPTEIAQLARKQCFEHLLKDDDESAEDFETMQEQKKHKRKKYASAKPRTVQRRSFKPRTKNVTLNSNASRSSPEDFTSELIEIQKSHVDPQLEFEAYGSSSKHSFGYDSFDDVKQEMPSPIPSETEEFLSEDNKLSEKTQGKDVNYEQPTNQEQNNNDADKLFDSQGNVSTNALHRNERRANRVTSKNTGEPTSTLDNETVLGEPFDYNEILNEKTKSEVDIEEEITGTSIQTKDGHDDYNQPHPAKRRVARTRKMSRSNNRKPIRTSKSPLKQDNVNPNPSKRAKRRTDGSDLTLRKDKVRLSLVRLVSDKGAESFSSENAAIDTDVQMVFEPYMGED